MTPTAHLTSDDRAGEGPDSNQPDPDELAELRARLHARILENINLGLEADKRFEKTSHQGGHGARLEWQQTHIKSLKRRVGDLEALVTALMVIIDPTRIVDRNDQRLERYKHDDCCGSCRQEQLELTDLGNVPRGGDIAARDLLVALVHQPYYCLLNGYHRVAPGTPPDGKQPVYQEAD